jgi:hypothetical protein
MRLLLSLLVCALLSAQDTAPPPDPVKWRLSGVPSTARAGDIFRVTLSANIDEGWHMYAFKKVDGGPVPLTVTAPMPQVFRIVHGMDTPVGLTAFEEEFEREVEFYIDEVEIGVPVQVLRDAKSGKWKLVLEAKYQASDNKQCLPAKTVRLESELQVTE